MVQFAVPTDQLSITYYIDRNIYNATSGSLVTHEGKSTSPFIYLYDGYAAIYLKSSNIRKYRDSFKVSQSFIESRCNMNTSSEFPVVVFYRLISEYTLFWLELLHHSSSIPQ